MAQPGRAPDAGPVLAVGLAPDSGLSDARLRRPARAPGRLSLDTDPWTRVWLGGKALGITPLIELPLAAGRHKLRLVNPAERIDTVVEVEIAPNTLVVKRLVL